MVEGHALFFVEKVGSEKTLPWGRVFCLAACFAAYEPTRSLGEARLSLMTSATAVWIIRLVSTRAYPSRGHIARVQLF